MEKRAIFPATMFLLAGASFLFGGWQFLHARAVQDASQQRMAFIITSIEKSDVSRAQKRELYTGIMEGLPPAPAAFGFDFSGSFASVDTGDSCSSDGQRAICRALTSGQADASTMTNVCGTCNPK